MSQIEVFATVIIAMIAATPGLLAFLGQRKKNDVDVAQAYKVMADEQIKEIRELKVRVNAMETQIDDLECERDALYKLVTEWQAGIGLLINQVTANGMTPVWSPKSAPPARRTKSS